ncbi:MAG TPA: cobyric acid synthase [Desulfobacteraceae bacterium]|nr:cobyric acid synthase [Desulfobacteraceae bacterium]
MKNHIAVLGTGSDVGKSIVAAAICRSLVDRGEKIAPFKAQNMSNNSGITPEGLEMGRAQIVQAEACRIPPHVDMNPILLKPTGEKQSQVVLNGLVHGNHTAMDYHKNKGFYQKAAWAAFDRLAATCDRVVMEGAGSCAEVNLMPNDIVNFAMAEYADADVILTADIHRGGVFAQLVGTLSCIPKSLQDRVKGFIINRFRGDIALFKDGVDWIEQRTGKPVFGVLPWYTHFKIDSEDSVEIEVCDTGIDPDDDRPSIAVIRLPHIANFTDFHALSQIPELHVQFIDRPIDLSRFKAVIIPGSKNTRADLSWAREMFHVELSKYLHQGGHILGICGGYQMLGSVVEDPTGLEGTPGKTDGLGFLPVETELKAPKTTTVSNFAWGDVMGSGYEIHMGVTRLTAGQPLIRITSRNQLACTETDGCITNDHHVAGTYVHGFFDYPEIADKWLEMIGVQTTHFKKREPLHLKKEKDYDLLKAHFEAHVDLSSFH